MTTTVAVKKTEPSIDSVTITLSFDDTVALTALLGAMRCGSVLEDLWGELHTVVAAEGVNAPSVFDVSPHLIALPRR